MRKRLLPAVLVACVFAACTVVAQNRGALTAVVVDGSGNALPGVTVTIDGPERRTAVTNQAGEFVMAGLLPGTYRVELTMTGFRTLVAALDVKAGDTRREKYTMTPGAVSETVKVESPVVADRVERRANQSVVAGAAAPLAIPMPSPIPSPYPYPRWPRPSGESYAHIDENPFHIVADEPLSTFSVDVDTASYSNVRRFLNNGTLPPVDAIRVEEMINYFRYSYPHPTSGAPFSVVTELAESPWNSTHRLVLIGLQGRQLPADDLPARNLVFLIDVSGSMQSPDKLPLVRNALRLLADTLTSRDRVAIVVYAGSSGLVLPSTPGDQRGAIHRAIADLEAGGSTNGAGGIQLAYHVARSNFVRGGINRVILATDGDFNVGITSQHDLLELIEHERASGVFLSVLGVGTGNLKDSTMEMLADKGNGHYAYLDSLQEARKVLINEAGSTLVTIAKDVKLQVEFNPRLVAGYRLIGYENRLLQNRDFNDDQKDAGEIGAGHSVTALYEIVPAGVEPPRGMVDPLKYQTRPASTTHSDAATTNELLTVKLRYKEPTADRSQLVVRTLENRVGPMSANLGFASAVAEVGMLMRGSKNIPSASFDAAIARARRFRENDEDGYRTEFVRLAEAAASLKRLARSHERDR